MKKGQIVEITNESTRSALSLGQLFSGGNAPSFTGKLLAVRPTLEEYSSLDETFEKIVSSGRARGIESGVVYYDTGSERPFWVDFDDVSVVESANLEEVENVW